MKVSIIMCAKNSMPYILSSLKSFENQTYKNKELIIVYKESDDQTSDFIRSLFSNNIKSYKFSGGIYRALNFGIKKSTGDIIGVLHSDDVFYDNRVLSTVVKKIENKKILYGSILYSKKNNLIKIKREWTNLNRKTKNYLPPHTATFVKKEIYSKFKYSTKYKIAGDTDLLIKLSKYKDETLFINNFIAIMRHGGLSTNFKYLLKKISEDLNIFKKHNLSIFDYILKIIFKFKQIIIFKKSYKLKFIKKINNYSKVKFINFNTLKNQTGFIISAFNLAYIAYNFKFNLISQNYLFWPDGLFSNIYFKKKKLPGRVFFFKFLKWLNKKKGLNKIYIVGSLPHKSENWIKKKIKNKFHYIKVPHYKTNLIVKFSDRLNFPSKSIIILTLPTPKQELIANKILKKNKNLSIFCFGGAINILSGYEKKVPQLLELFNLEWLWRLRFDTIRRLKRLIESIYLFAILSLTSKNNLF